MKGPARTLSALAAAFAVAACGPEARWARAERDEAAGRYAAAVAGFERFARERPADPRAPEALVRAAGIYLSAYRRCPEARPLLERAAREYPEGTWPARARGLLLDCPEYFPLRDGDRWVFVDSQTGGANMRLELTVARSSGAARVEGAYFAGKRRFQEFRRGYVKEDWAVWELDGRDRVPILKYPYTAGMSWQGTRAGRPVEFRVESDRERVRVRAGEFHDCVKVRESQSGAPAWKYDYYAPGVGKVKTTIGGPGFENPNTELQSAGAEPAGRKA